MRQLSFCLVVVLVSGCSQVSLQYGLLSAGNPSNTLSPTRSGALSEQALANLNIQARIQTDATTLQALRLRLTLEHRSNPAMNRTLVLSAQEFINNPTLLWKDLSSGQAQLKIEVLNAQGLSLFEQNAPLNLQGNLTQNLDFELRQTSATLSLQVDAQSSALTSGSPLPASSIQLPTPASANPAPPPTGSTGSSTPNVASPTGSGSSDTGNSAPLDLHFKVLESSNQSLSTVWEAPAGLNVQGYRILLNGQVVAENHPVANYRFENLFADASYKIEIQPILSNGSILSTPVIESRTSSGSSGGGGGGGGGGSSGGGGGGGGATNQAPQINGLTASKTTLTGLGYPVKLNVSASDDQPLNDAAYSWSCQNCGDASFDRQDSAEVVWTAPTTPGTYTLEVAVSDGVNPPVTRTQAIVVEHQTATVTVNGEYQ